MLAFDDILENPPDNSIFKMNINPIRVGFQLFKTIDDIQRTHANSVYFTNKLKQKLIEQLVIIIDAFKDTEDIIPMIDQPGIDGRNIIWYFNQYEICQILNTKIMDKFINSKLNGKHRKMNYWSKVE